MNLTNMRLMENTKVLYLICGIPGSGKSWLAGALFDIGAVDAIFAADDWFERNGGYKFVPEKVVEAHSWCMRQTREAMKQGLNIAVHNTFTKDVYLKQYLDMAKEFGYNIIEVVMKSTFESVHGVPVETVNRMKLQLQARLDNDWALS